MIDVLYSIGWSLWSPMLTGNVVICPEVFSWSMVDQVVLSGEHLLWTMDTCEDFQISLSSNSLQLGTVTLPVTNENLKNISNFMPKAGELFRLVKRLNTGCNHLNQLECSGSNETSDSDSEVIIDPPIAKAFSDSEWAAITRSVYGKGGLKEIFDKAKAQNFDNHAGKLFILKLMKLCSMIDEKKKGCVNLSTCSSGQYQPGSSNFIKKVIRSTPSSSRSTPLPGSEEQGVSTKECTEMCQRFSDSAYWDEHKQCYSVLAEIKNSESASCNVQCTEQMFGAFRKHQNVMLGIAVNPNTLSLKVLRKTGQRLEMNTLENMEILGDGTLETLTRFIIAFMYFVDC